MKNQYGTTEVKRLFILNNLLDKKVIVKINENLFISNKDILIKNYLENEISFINLLYIYFNGDKLKDFYKINKYLTLYFKINNKQLICGIYNISNNDEINKIIINDVNLYNILMDLKKIHN